MRKKRNEENKIAVLEMMKTTAWAKERKNRLQLILYILNKRYGDNFDFDKNKIYDSISLDRICRNEQFKDESLRGLDYNEKYQKSKGFIQTLKD